MSASALSSREQTASNPSLRRVRLRHDLGAIADLIEMSFGPSMDSGGRAAVREMRSLSRTGPLLWLLAGLDRNIRAMSRGFVWVDSTTGRLVGNVSIYDANYDNIWVVANVAVHPDVRRQGIATEMMEATLDLAEQRAVSAVILQVEADNFGARTLYERLGFNEQRIFTTWRRRFYLERPQPLPDMPHITFRSGHEWKPEYALAQQLRPQGRGGLGWLRPTRPASFRKSLLGHLLSGFSFRRQQRWVIRDERQVVAAMSMEHTFGARFSRVDLLVQPEYRQYHDALVNFAIRHIADMGRSMMVEHPADDQYATTIFEAYEFEATRQLVHMLWTPGG